MFSAWSLSRTSIVSSRTEAARPTLIVFTSPIRPSPLAIVPATLASEPGRCGNLMRYV